MPPRPLTASNSCRAQQLSPGRRSHAVAHRPRQLRRRPVRPDLPGHRSAVLRPAAATGIRFRGDAGGRSRPDPPGLPGDRAPERIGQRRVGARFERGGGRRPLPRPRCLPGHGRRAGRGGQPVPNHAGGHGHLRAGRLRSDADLGNRPAAGLQHAVGRHGNRCGAGHRRRRHGRRIHRRLHRQRRFPDHGGAAGRGGRAGCVRRQAEQGRQNATVFDADGRGRQRQRLRDRGRRGGQCLCRRSNPLVRLPDDQRRVRHGIGRCPRRLRAEAERPGDRPGLLDVPGHRGYG